MRKERNSVAKERKCTYDGHVGGKGEGGLKRMSKGRGGKKIRRKNNVRNENGKEWVSERRELKEREKECWRDGGKRKKG